MGKYFGRLGIMYGEGLSSSKSNFLTFPAEDGVPIGGIFILEKASRFQLTRADNLTLKMSPAGR